MKKLTTLLVVFLFSAGVNFAQSSEAYITQMDQNNDAFLTQSSGAYAEVEQIDNGYNLLTGIGQQDAYSHSSSMYVAQASGWGTNAKGRSGNELKAMQYGNGHVIELDQHNAGFAKIEQRGNNNSTDLQQYNGAHEADIYQSNRGNTVGLLQNESFSGVSKSYASISQTGRFNTVEGNPDGGYVWKGAQKGDNNELYLNQSGNNNTLQLYQFGEGGLNFADVMQSSNGNLAAINQQGGNNNAVITQ